MSQSTRSKSSTMIRRNPSAPFSNLVTLQEQDSRNPFSAAANSSLSSSSRMLSLLPAREVQGWGVMIFSVAGKLLCEMKQIERGLLRRNGRQRPLGAFADDGWGDENDQLLLLVGIKCAGEEFAEPRDVTEEGDLF